MEGNDSRHPVFYEPSGRRWAVFWSVSIVISTALLGSVAWVLLHSFVDPKLPALALEATEPPDPILASAGVVFSASPAAIPGGEEAAPRSAAVPDDAAPLLTGRSSVTGQPGLPAKPIIASTDPLDLCLECLWQQARRTIDGSAALVPKLVSEIRSFTQPKTPHLLRYAFMVNWDDSSVGSVRTHADSIDVLVPEWMHLSEDIGVLLDDDNENLGTLRKLTESGQLRIMPMINNALGDRWRGDLVHRLLVDRSAREKLIAALKQLVEKNGFAGVTIDFENLAAGDMMAFETFVHDAAASFHASKLALNVTIPLVDPGFRAGVLSKSADAVILMAYDEHWAESAPGPIASQEWLEAGVKARLAESNPAKIVVALGNYAYDWREGDDAAEVLTTHQALMRAQQTGSQVVFDGRALNPSFDYRDADNARHHVWYLDAVTFFNQMKVARKEAVAGVALWRAGGEDNSVWTVLRDPMAARAASLEKMTSDVDLDYRGDGEILRVIKRPVSGHRNIRTDWSGFITSETITSYPRGYEIARWGDSALKRVALTFDDGPDETYTPAVLDVLRKYHVPATFFLVGSQVMRRPQIVRRIVDEGHEIGNHTFTHPKFDEVSRLQLSAEVNATQQLIESITGRSTLLFRPPFAIDIEPQTADEMDAIAAVSAKGYYTVNMRIDADDWKPGSTPDEIFQRVIARARQEHAHVILMHDAGGNREATVLALPRIIEALRADGYTFERVSALLGKTRDDVMPVIAMANPVKLDQVGYTVIGSLDYFVTLIFFLAIVLGLARSALIVLVVRRRRRDPVRPPMDDVTVGVVVPAYNEEKVIAKTIHSLLASTWTRLDILVIDDGSSDDTAGVVERDFADEPRVRVVRKANGGKSEAVNLGFAMLETEFVVAMDADTIFLPDTIASLISNFSDPSVGAVAGNAKVGNRINLLTRWQALEYIVAQNLDRRAFERFNCISVVPGAVGAWRRERVLEVGGYTSDTLAEDADLTIRMIRHGSRVVFEDKAVALTEAPATIGQFVKQRYRWTFGMMQAAVKNRDALTRSKPNAIGLMLVPNILLYQILFPCIAPIVDLFLVLSLFSVIVGAIYYADSPLKDGVWHLFVGYFLFMAVDYFVAIVAFFHERDEQKSLLWTLVLQRFLYRQILYYVTLKAVFSAIRGRAVGWFKLERQATVSLQTVAVETERCPAMVRR